ncbi:peroxiredoxin family protein [Candidatus Latescibacterota bacterium]
MKNIFIIALVLLIAGCGGNSEESASKVEQAAPETVKAPEFTLPDLSGESVSLASYSDKTVLVVFWATWCPDCKAEIPILKEVHDKYKDTDFTILSISVDNKPDKLNKFIEENGIEYSVLYDKDTLIAKSYGVVGIPANFIVDPDGNGYFFGPNIESAMAKAESLMMSN